MGMVYGVWFMVYSVWFIVYGFKSRFAPSGDEE